MFDTYTVTVYVGAARKPFYVNSDMNRVTSERNGAAAFGTIEECRDFAEAFRERYNRTVPADCRIFGWSAAKTRRTDFTKYARRAK